MYLSNPWDNINLELIRKNIDIIYNDLDIHILFVVLGEVHLTVDDEIIKIRKNDFYIVNKWKNIKIELHNSTLVHFTFKYLVNRVDAERYSHIFQGSSLIIPSDVSSTISTYLTNLIDLFVFREERKDSFVFQNYYGIIANLEEHFKTSIKIPSKGSTREKIKNLTKYIDNNFSEDIRLANIASDFFVSEQYLSKIFYEEVGQTFTEYIIERRLEQVKKLLRNTDISITDVAFSCGFNNINSFNKIFKKYNSITPRDFRNKYKVNIKTSNDDEENIDELKRMLENSNQINQKNFFININEEIKYKKAELLINLGYAEDILELKAKGHLEKLDELPFKYGRIWGIASNNILPEREGEFDFSKVDFIIDSVLEKGLIPFLDIGFMGKVIKNTYTTAVSVKEFVLPSFEGENLLKRYSKFFEHCIDRYGIHEVSSWLIEIWKPNSYILAILKSNHISKLKFKEGILDITNPSDYIKFFSIVKSLITELVPNIRVGGCGLSLDIEDIQAELLIRQWVKNSIQPDFFTIKIFPINGEDPHKYTGKLSYPVSPDENFMLNKIRNIKKKMEESQIEIPLFITEFNISTINRDPLNDSSFKGPYILKNIMDVIYMCDVLGYGFFSDLSLIDSDVYNRELFGGSGLLSKNGIPKIGYYAFKFLNIINENILYINNQLLITRNDNGIYHIIIHNYSHLNSNYYYNAEAFYDKNSIYSLFSNNLINRFEIHLNGFDINKNNVIIKSFEINYIDGNLLEEKYKLTDIDVYDKDIIDYLLKKAIPTMNISKLDVIDEVVIIKKELKAHEIVMIEIK